MKGEGKVTNAGQRRSNPAGEGRELLRVRKIRSFFEPDFLALLQDTVPKLTNLVRSVKKILEANMASVPPLERCGDHLVGGSLRRGGHVRIARLARADRLVQQNAQRRFS